MTDAEKLRRLARELDEVNADQRGIESAPIYPGDPELLFRIADLLDAVPPETLEAIKNGRWKAVPLTMPDEMKRKVGGWGPNLDLIWKELLSAAPAKPEE